jgi:hypothetical protein
MGTMNVKSLLIVTALVEVATGIALLFGSG